jgi:hypothetical protein
LISALGYARRPEHAMGNIIAEHCSICSLEKSGILWENGNMIM